MPKNFRGSGSTVDIYVEHEITTEPFLKKKKLLVRGPIFNFHWILTPDPVYISSTSLKPLGWVGLGQAHNVFQPPIKVDTNGPCLAFLAGSRKE